MSRDLILAVGLAGFGAYCTACMATLRRLVAS